MALDRAEIDRRMAAFGRACRQRGARLTHQRMEIFRQVAGSEEHPDAESVFRGVRRRIPEISLNTVYRTLGLLEEQELIMRVDAQSDRARYDGNTQRHAHFVCSKCGAVRDCRIRELDKLEIPGQISDLGKINAWQVQLRGVCRRCLAGEDQKKQSM